MTKEMKALIELHQQTLEVLREAIALMRSMQAKPFTFDFTPAPNTFPQPVKPLDFGPTAIPQWPPATLPYVGDPLPGSGGTVICDSNIKASTTMLSRLNGEL